MGKKYEKRLLKLRMKQHDGDTVLDALMDVAWTTIDNVMTTQYTTWTDDMLERMAGRCRALAYFADALGLAKVKYEPGPNIPQDGPSSSQPEPPKQQRQSGNITPQVGNALTELLRGGDERQRLLALEVSQVLARHAVEDNDNAVARFLLSLFDDNLGPNDALIPGDDQGRTMTSPEEKMEGDR